MPSILSSSTIVNAKDSVKTYSDTTAALYEELSSLINQLRADGFQGDASDGYDEFFRTKATPALVDNLNAVTDGITSMLDTIQEQLLNTMDPKLGEVNRNPGQ